MDSLYDCISCTLLDVAKIGGRNESGIIVFDAFLLPRLDRIAKSCLAIIDHSELLLGSVVMRWLGSSTRRGVG